MRFNFWFDRATANERKDVQVLPMGVKWEVSESFIKESFIKRQP